MNLFKARKALTILNKMIVGSYLENGRPFDVATMEELISESDLDYDLPLQDFMGEIKKRMKLKGKRQVDSVIEYLKLSEYVEVSNMGANYRVKILPQGYQILDNTYFINIVIKDGLNGYMAAIALLLSIVAILITIITALTQGSVTK